jgi:hypothetical protein
MELKSNFGNSKGGAIDQERSLLDKLSLEFKNMIFQVIQSMLKDEEQSILINAFTIIIQFMQLTYIPFNKVIWKVWQNEIVSEQLNKITG